MAIEAALKPINGARDVISAAIMGMGYLQIDIDRANDATRWRVDMTDRLIIFTRYPEPGQRSRSFTARMPSRATNNAINSPAIGSACHQPNR